jgi:HK97 family phage major capsid protein
MTINIPRGTTGTVVASQTAENQSVTEVDFDETTLTVDVRTLAGMQDVSRQSIERGYNVDQIIFADLAAAYAVELDKQVINGAGTSGTHKGILNTANIGSVTTGTATAASVVAKVAQAIATVAGSRYMAPDVIVMHPRRWGWLTAQSDSSGRPYVVPAPYGPQNARGVVDNQGYGFVGSLQGLPVYTDANIPTTISTSTITGSTEDNIIVARSSDLLLWEDSPAPRQFRFEETGSGTLTIRLVVAGDSAFTAGWYPAGVAVISGSGMTTPTYP